MARRIVAPLLLFGAFAGFSKPWKAQFEGELGGHWGHWTVDGKQKIRI
jgi:hypothetical protein